MSCHNHDGASYDSGGIKESGQKPLGGSRNGNGNGKEPITVHPFNPAPQTMSEALGKQRKAIGAFFTAFFKGVIIADFIRLIEHYLIFRSFFFCDFFAFFIT